MTNDALREILQSMSEGIIMVDENGKIAVANPVAEQLFGYDRIELQGMSLESLLPERYRGRHHQFRKGFNAHPEPRRMGIGRDLTALRKDGTEFPVEISLSYTRVKGELFVMAFISDITLRKKAEDGLKRSEEQLIVYAAELEQKVQARTEALNNSIAKLEKEVKERKKAEEEVRKSLEKERELNDLKSKFVSIASHEFRTPLSTVLSSASLIQQYKDKGDLDKVDKHVQRIKSSVNHLTMILNDFLSLGKLEEGKVEINKEKIDLPSFANEIKDDVNAFLKEGQEVNVQCEGTDTQIESDARILRNIMFNLISNASKYSEPHKNIFLTCSKKNNQIVFTIRDEGIGIPQEDQKHLFERFFRASNAGNIQGTGLGLNIIKRYADLLKGTVTFNSEYGKGTTFTVVIPND
jgi:PAS domain S-box-containing protein